MPPDLPWPLQQRLLVAPSTAGSGASRRGRPGRGGASRAVRVRARRRRLQRHRPHAGRLDLLRPQLTSRRPGRAASATRPPRWPRGRRGDHAGNRRRRGARQDSRAACATDHLFDVIIHGARSSPVQPVGWAADALALLGAFDDVFDWERMAFLARGYSVAVPVLSALEWLRHHAPGQVPQSALDAIAHIPVPSWQRLEHAVKIRPRRRLGSFPCSSSTIAA
jgi:hypothetical protein